LKLSNLQTFKAYVLSNEIIQNDLAIGKYIASIKLINCKGELLLQIKLSWESISTIDVFSQLGLFCSKVGAVTNVTILAEFAELTMALLRQDGELETVNFLGRSIDKILDTLERCLTPDVKEVLQGDGLDSPDSQKSKDLAAIYLDDVAWNVQKEQRKLPTVDPEKTIPYRYGM
jgi:hypothetical protein